MGVGRMGPAGLGSLEWAWNPFGHDPTNGWSRSTLRPFWKEMRWSRTPLVMVQDLQLHAINWDKAL